MGRPKTVDDVIRFILANAPPKGVQIKKNPFEGRCFEYALVDGAIGELHAQGRFPDLEVYDIKGTRNLWNTEEGKNYDLARRATKTLLNKLQKDQPNKTLAEILTEITHDTFYKYPINKYGTTLSGMFQEVHEDSPYDALKDLIDNDPELTEYKDFQPYDMKKAPQNMWNKKDGSKKHELAREATKTLLNKLQKDQPNKTLAEILTEITCDTFYKYPINKYGTTLSGMLNGVHEDSPYDALKDLIDNDPELAEYKDFQPYDMKSAPRETWNHTGGNKNHELARLATKTLLNKLRSDTPGRAFEEILAEITQDTFRKYPINKYGTTLNGMIQHMYENSPYQTLKDLAEHDPEYAEFLPVIETMTHRAA